MDLFGALLDEVIPEVFDEEWVQTVDYEHIPFRCRRFHEHGDLLRDCPLSKAENKSKTNTLKDTDSFHKVVQGGKSGKRGPKQHQNEGQQVSQNQFQVLEEDEEITAEDQAMNESPEEKEKEENREHIQENDEQKGIMMSDTEPEMDQEMTQSEMELEDHELQEILDRENLDLEGFLIQGTSGRVESLPQEEFNRIQQLFLWKTQAKVLEGENNIER